MRDRTPLQFPPGVVRMGSEAEMAGKWYDTHLVRWVEGVLRPINGWEKIVFEVIPVPASTIRKVHSWMDESGIMRTAMLCDGHLYILDGNTVTDISPVPPINPPAVDPIIGGYGDDKFSLDLYGDRRPDQFRETLVGAAFSLDNWGEDLLAMVSSDGRLLKWSPRDPPGSVAVAVPNAPIGNRAFVITPERHVMLFQMGGKFNAFGWCHQEDIENWAFSDPLSMAGFYEVQPAAPILAAASARFGVLFFTASGAFLSRYLGVPYIYSLDPIARHGSPLTQASLVVMSDAIVWPATDGFWRFNGSTIEPVKCPILDWMQRTANFRYLSLATVGMYLGMQTECWWFFPSGDAKENDRYLVWNPDEQWWAMGQLSRTCGFPGSPLNFPLMSDGKQLFRHEYGLFYYDAPELPYAQSGAINIAQGARQTTVQHAVVDTRAPRDDVQFFLGTRKGRQNPNNPPARLKGPYHPREDGKLDFRGTGRDLVIRIQSTRSGVQPWTFGQMLAHLAPRGRR